MGKWQEGGEESTREQVKNSKWLLRGVLCVRTPQGRKIYWCGGVGGVKEFLSMEGNKQTLMYRPIRGPRAAHTSGHVLFVNK